MTLRAKTAFQGLSYGIPEFLIAKWCGVNIATAKRYKDGTRSPSSAALELFRLNFEGRIVPPEWSGFCFQNGRMWDPDGREFTHAQLRAYQIALHMLQELARGSPHLRNAVHALFQSANRARLGYQRVAPEPGISRRRAQLAAESLSAPTQYSSHLLSP
jgi:hypothetical protein